MSVQRVERASGGEVARLITVSHAEGLEFVTRPVQKCRTFVKPISTFYSAYGSALSKVGGPTGLSGALGSDATTL